MHDAKSPRVSILIPNYNNGKQSSVTGGDDLIANLLKSLDRTLHDDPTPFEIIAYDDGSTDDSLQTLRQWSQRRLRDRPFLQLIEAEHCGVLSRSANLLSRRARGDILVRLDGDVVCLTGRWVSRLCQVFDHGAQRLGIVGPKQLGPDGRIIAYGDWVLHPCGYVHVGQDLPRDAVRYPMEVDHVMGCFYCCRKRVFEELNGYDEQILRGQTVDFGLRARLAGWFCMAVPHIEFLHAHSLRIRRQTRADSHEGVDYTLKVFEQKWGFHRLAADLDEVGRRYAGTGLTWNRQWFGPAARTSPAAEPVNPGMGQWTRFVKDAAFRQQVDWQIKVTMDVVRQVGGANLAGQVGCGQGLAVHLLARAGLNCIGMDRQQANIELARRCTGGQTYPQSPPRFAHIADQRLGSLPLGNEQVDLLLLFEQMERHANPVALLREARRVLAPGGKLLVISRRRPPETFDPSDPSAAGRGDGVHLYRYRQLLNQIKAAGGWTLWVDGQSDDPTREMMIVLAQREAGEVKVEDSTAVNTEHGLPAAAAV